MLRLLRSLAPQAPLLVRRYRVPIPSIKFNVPLSASEFDACIASTRLQLGQQSLGLALSGGPDSMALMLLLRDWCAANKSTLTAFTVDHGLRPNSTEEAHQVGEWARNAGVKHEILQLTWAEKPQTKIMALARKRRYEALIEGCEKAGIRMLLAGHQLEDQLETFLFRMSRNSGITGLACMHPVVILSPSAVLVRPLLSVPKSRLIAVCEQHKQPFVRDPTNDNLTFTRNCIRHGLRELQDMALTCTPSGGPCPSGGPSAASDPGAAQRTPVGPYEWLIPALSITQRIARDLHVAGNAFLAEHCQYDKQYGFCTLEVDPLLALPREFGMRVLSRALLCIGSQPYPPRFRILDDTLWRLRLMARQWDDAKTMVAAGCLLIPQSDRRRITIARECIPPSETRAPLRLNQTVHWDGRFLVSAQVPARFLKTPSLDLQSPGSLQAAGLPPQLAQMSVRRMTEQDWALLVQHSPRLRMMPRSFPHQVRLSLPLITDADGGIVAVPHIGFYATKLVRFTATYAPRNRMLETAYLEEPADE